VPIRRPLIVGELNRRCLHNIFLIPGWLVNLLNKLPDMLHKPWPNSPWYRRHHGIRIACIGSINCPLDCDKVRTASRLTIRSTNVTTAFCFLYPGYRKANWSQKSDWAEHSPFFDWFTKSCRTLLHHSRIVHKTFFIWSAKCCEFFRIIGLIQFLSQLTHDT